MYCPHCSAEHTFGLKYCKRCGGNLNISDPPQPESERASSWKLTGAAWAIGLATVAICLGGLGIVFSTAFDLARPLSVGQSPSVDATPIAMAMIIFGSATVFGISALLLRLFTRLIRGIQETPRPARFIKPGVTEYPQAQIPAPPIGMTSVTEHTTRNFDRLYEEQRARESRGKVTQ